MKVQLPYGRTHMIAEIPDNRIQAILRSRLESYMPSADEAKLVEAALQKRFLRKQIFPSVPSRG